MDDLGCPYPELIKKWETVCVRWVCWETATLEINWNNSVMIIEYDVILSSMSIIHLISISSRSKVVSVHNAENSLCEGNVAFTHLRWHEKVQIAQEVQI